MATKKPTYKRMRGRAMVLLSESKSEPLTTLEFYRYYCATHRKLLAAGAKCPDCEGANGR
jgi:hypothetical protein